MKTLQQMLVSFVNTLYSVSEANFGNTIFEYVYEVIIMKQTINTQEYLSNNLNLKETFDKSAVK